MEQKIQKKFFVFQVIPFELGVVNSHNLEQDISKRQSMCQQTRVRLYLTLGETFSKSTSLGMMKNMIEALSWRFRNYLGRFHMFTVKARSEAPLFREWSNQVFHCL